MDFSPHDFTEKTKTIPFYEDVTSEGGWSGHTTSKNYQTLKSEIIAGFSNLGATITAWVEGTFSQGTKNPRLGIKIEFIIDLGGGRFAPGAFVVAALPAKPPKIHATATQQASYKKRQQNSLKMAMFNIVLYLKGMNNLKMLSPGSEPLVPWLLVPGKENTFSEMINAERALPSGEETVEGEFSEIVE